MTSRAVEKLFDTLGILDSSDSEELRRLASVHTGRQSSGQVRPAIPKLYSRARRPTIAKSESARIAIARVVHRVPEAVVKVSSVAKTTGRVWAHLTYITRNGRIVAETDGGQQLTCLEDVRELQEYWSGCPTKQRTNGKLAVNFVLSMPAGTNVERLTSAVRAFSRDAFAGHEYAFVLHTPDTDPDPQAPPHPHAHICVRAGSVSGKRLLHGPSELWAFRQLFAQKLREQGIDAVATPRSVRGVVKKAARQDLYHISKDRQKKDRRSTVGLAKLREAARAVLNGTKIDGIWEARVAQRRDELCTGWLALAGGLEASGRSEDTLLGRDIRRFVSNLPAPRTERQDIARQMRERRDELDHRKGKQTMSASPTDAARPESKTAGLTATPVRNRARGKDDYER
ncbi:hypothetical protein [Burkholderia vietnamiensis]|uniref:hypothetical protein n=1 Tax=Burkholderia vietnamiensis TaxID=60552 RepID=UPI0007521D72|nr:hypothetical protein [Burkholderia vietnamiensis]MBR8034505.1 hypothetical protein [Burkholderia vietnamiensis]